MAARVTLNKDYWPGEVVMLFEYYWIEGLRAHEIAPLIFRSKNSVKGFIYRAGLKRKRRPYHPEYARYLARLAHKNGKADPDIVGYERRDGAIYGSTLPPLRSLVANPQCA